MAKYCLSWWRRGGRKKVGSAFPFILRREMEPCKGPGCTRVGTSLCGRCRKYSYCSTECQSADWRTHKPICKALSSASPAAALEPAAAASGGSAAPQPPPQPAFAGFSIRQLKDELHARGISTTGMTERSELVGALEAAPPVAAAPAAAAASSSAAVGGGGSSSAAVVAQQQQQQLEASEPPPVVHIPTGMDLRIKSYACACCGEHMKNDDPRGGACGGCREVVYCKAPKTCLLDH